MVKELLKDLMMDHFPFPYENKIALNRAHSSIILDNYKLIKFRDNNEQNILI